MQAEPLTPAIVKETIQRHWTGRAATYDNDAVHGLHSEAQRQAWLALIQRWAGPVPLDALDVGCGTGFLALQLAGLGHRVVGVDSAEAMLTVARAKASQAGLAIDFQLADAAELPFAPASFDLVIERHVLWTLLDPAAALAEWGRVLRPGGRLMLIHHPGRGSGPHARGDYAPIRSSLPLVQRAARRGARPLGRGERIGRSVRRAADGRRCSLRAAVRHAMRCRRENAAEAVQGGSAVRDHPAGVQDRPGWTDPARCQVAGLGTPGLCRRALHGGLGTAASNLPGP